jgi:hypothetical protein
MEFLSSTGMSFRTRLPSNSLKAETRCLEIRSPTAYSGGTRASWRDFSNSAALLTYAAMPFEGDRFIVSVFRRCEIQPSFGRLEIHQSPWHNGCLEYCAAFFALRSKDSFAPSELRAFLLPIPRVPPSLHPGLSSYTPSAFSTFSCSCRFRSAFAILCTSQ